MSRFTKEEIDSWPENHKRCCNCLYVKAMDLFGPHKSGLFGKRSTCISCKKAQDNIEWNSLSIETKMYRRARSRAQKKGLEFSIQLEDIYIPQSCPILGVTIKPGQFGICTDESPSLDRINPSLGYIKGNVQVISNRANVLKNNATIEELQALVQWFSMVYNKDTGPL